METILVFWRTKKIILNMILAGSWNLQKSLNKGTIKQYLSRFFQLFLRYSLTPNSKKHKLCDSLMHGSGCSFSIITVTDVLVVIGGQFQ